MAKNTPLETVECKSFAKFLVDKNEILEWKKLPKILFSKLTQDFYTGLKGKRKAMYFGKMKAEGKRRGVPDFIVAVPAEASRTGKAILFFVEMKRQKFTPSDVEPEQLDWINLLVKISNVDAKICGGAAEAKIYLSNYLKY